MDHIHCVYKYKLVGCFINPPININGNSVGGITTPPDDGTNITQPAITGFTLLDALFITYSADSK